MLRPLSKYGTKYLFSAKAVIFSFILLLIFCLIGVLIPQKGAVGPQEWKASYTWLHTLQFTSIYSSVWFLLTALFLVILLTHTLYIQFKQLIRDPGEIEKRGRARLQNQSEPSFPVSHDQKNQIIPEAIKIARTYGYRLFRESSSSTERLLFFTRNRFGRWGSWIFHLGLLLIILGSIWGFTFRKRGFQQIIQNELFSTKEQPWLSKNLGLLARQFILDFQLKVTDFQPVYGENDKIKDLSSQVSLIDQQGKTHEHPLAIGQPISFQGITIYQSFDYGYSLGFTLFDHNTKTQTLTNFCLDAATRKELPLVGQSDLPKTDYHLHMEFHPDLLKPSRTADCPGVDLLITKNEQPVFKGTVLYSQGLNLGRHRLVFSSLDYWTGLAFVKNQGISLVKIGFFLTILGLGLLYFLPPEELYLSLSSRDSLWYFSLAGWTKRYSPFLEQRLHEITEKAQNFFMSPKAANENKLEQPKGETGLGKPKQTDETTYPGE